MIEIKNILIETLYEMDRKCSTRYASEMFAFEPIYKHK